VSKATGKGRGVVVSALFLALSTLVRGETV